MTVKKWIAFSLAIVTLLAGARANAQIYTHAASPFEPGYFGHDLQFFAPGDFSEFGDQPELPIGWYFTYARMYLQTSRPDRSINSFETDPTWGNRYQVGFMTQDDVGLDFEYMRVRGPNLVQPNAFGFFPRFDPINVAEYNSTELNRTFRMISHDGGVFEPFIGARYATLADGSDPVNFTLDPIDGQFRPGVTQNNIIGGQIGFRYFKRKGRWTVTCGAKAFPAINFQQFRTGADIARNDFTLGTDARLEASYNVTRDISLMVGWEFIYYGMGIARASIPISQEYLMTGVSMGIEVNYR